MFAAQVIRIAEALRDAVWIGGTVLAVAATGMAGPCLAEPGVSGTYVSASPNSAEMILIIQTLDGRLTGRMESATLTPAGESRISSVTLEGAANGATLMLTPRSILLSLASPPSFSGVIDGDALDLSWQGGHRMFRRGNIDQFRVAVAGLETRSAQIKAQTAYDAAMADLAQLTLVLDGIEATAHDVHDQLASASEQYRELFSRMHNRRRSQAALSNIPGQGLATMRSGTDAQSYALDIDAVGLEVGRLQSEMHGQFQNARLLAGSIDAHCTNANRSAPCAGVAVQRIRLESLKSVLQADFDATVATYNEASVDVPPGRRLIQSLVRN